MTRRGAAWLSPSGRLGELVVVADAGPIPTCRCELRWRSAPRAAVPCGASASARKPPATRPPFLAAQASRRCKPRTCSARIWGKPVRVGVSGAAYAKRHAEAADRRLRVRVNPLAADRRRRSTRWLP